MSSVVILILFATNSGESDDSDCPEGIEEKVPGIAAVSEAVESGKDAWIFILKHFVPWYSVSGHAFQQRMGWPRIAMAPRVKLMVLRLLTPTMLLMSWSLKHQPPTRMGLVEYLV